MTNYNILFFPHKDLREIASPIVSFNEEIEKVAIQMLHLMKQHHGIGLAGNQIGYLKRIFVMDIPEDESTDPNDEQKIFINPKILHQSGTIEYEEGCLSLPKQTALITRSNEITIEFYDLKGEKKELDAQGLKAVCIQHEIDHLDGTLFIDYVSSLKRAFIKKKLAQHLRSIQ